MVISSHATYTFLVIFFSLYPLLYCFVGFFTALFSILCSYQLIPTWIPTKQITLRQMTLLLVLKCSDVPKTVSAPGWYCL